MVEKSKELYLICHTHWDREWYLPFQRFRMHLTHLIDQIIKICEADPNYRHFNLDGQTIVVEDYLLVRPEMKEKLMQLIKENRVAVGPWYNQPDEWTSGELLVRNLLRGNQLAIEYGGRQNIGYCPDTFGHIAQMPQILREAEIDNFIYGRGLGDEYDDPQFSIDYYWESPDGSRVLTYWLPPSGYANAKNHPTTPDEFKSFMLFAFGRIAKSKTKVVFLGSGGDHYIPQKETPAMIAAFNEDPDMQEELDGGQMHFATLTEFVDAIKAREDANDPFMIVKGELRQGRTDVYEPGSISSRIYLKQWNAFCWQKLCYNIEPLTTWLWAESGFFYKNKSFIDLAWKYLLQNQPHDSICGCSIDPIHEDMEHRFANCNQIMDELILEQMQLIQMRFTGTKPKGIPLIVFNPHTHDCQPICRVRVSNRPQQPEPDLVYAADWSPNKQYFLMDSQGNKIHSVIRKVWFMNDYDILDVLWIQPNHTGMGYNTYFLVEAEDDDSGGLTDDISNSIYENSWGKIEFNSNGTFNLLLKESNQQFVNLHMFEDQADGGDGYDFYAVPNDIPLNSLNITAQITGIKHIFGAEFNIELDIDLPKALNHPRTNRLNEFQPQHIQSKIIIWDHIPRIDFTTIIDNKILDHRLRAVFPTPFSNDQVQAASIYDVINRGIGLEAWLETKAKWMQKPVPTNHVSQFIDIHEDNKGSLALFNKGLPEYEARRGENGIDLIQTLFRCVRYEGGEMVGRGRAGDPTPTPGSQLQRRLTLEYALYFHPNSWDKDCILSRANEFILPLAINGGSIVIPGRRADQFDQFDDEAKNLPFDSVLLSNSNANVILSTLKQAELSQRIILRVFNPTSDIQTAAIKFGFTLAQVSRTNILETVKESEHDLVQITDDHSIQLSVMPKKIITFEIIPNACQIE